MKVISIYILILFNSTFLYAYQRISAPFKVGEYLEYKISALGIPVAIQKTKVIKITNINSREVYHINTDIETLPVISKIYHLHDTIDTYIDTETLLPVKMHTKIQEGRWRNEVIIDIDQDEGKLRYKDNKGIKNLEFKGNLLGLDSVLYFLRSITPYKNEIIKFAISKKRDIIYMRAKVKSLNEKLYIKALDNEKPISTIHYTHKDEEEAGIWITNDENRIPVKIVSIIIPIGDYGVITFVNKLTHYSQ